MLPRFFFWFLGNLDHHNTNITLMTLRKRNIDISLWKMTKSNGFLHYVDRKTIFPFRNKNLATFGWQVQLLLNKFSNISLLFMPLPNRTKSRSCVCWIVEVKQSIKKLFVAEQVVFISYFILIPRCLRAFGRALQDEIVVMWTFFLPEKKTAFLLIHAQLRSSTCVFVSYSGNIHASLHGPLSRMS
jgi:hypothetical protein